MAGSNIIVNVGPGETRIALVEDGRLAQLWLERPDAGSHVGDVFLGRVEAVLPGIQAAFVDIGLERAGFLGLADARPVTPETLPPPETERITDYVSEGDAVLVQVRRDATAEKGVKLTTRITLTGHALVLAVGMGGVRLSRRLEGAERERLVALAEEVRQGDEGLILRTAANGADRDRLAHEAEALRHAWAGARAAAAKTKPPARLLAELDPLRRVLRDRGTELGRVVVDDAALLGVLGRFCTNAVPGVASKLEMHKGPEAIFDAFGIEEQIDDAFDPRVALPGGGDLIIEETAALVAIDVNSGGRAEGGPEDTAYRINLEAAREIAHQIRLRNLAGLIAIDFLSMKQRRHRDQVLEKLAAETAHDGAEIYVCGFSRAGLVEMTRRRRGQSLAALLGGVCPVCAGRGRVHGALTQAFAVLRAALREGAAMPGAEVTVRAAPAIVKVLETDGALARRDAEARLGQALRLVADATLPADGFEVAAAPRKGKR